MSQDVSVRGRRSGLRRDTAHHRQRALDAAGPRRHRQGDLVHPERELLDHYERKYLGWIHLVGGIVGLAAGFGAFSGAAWARWLGILIATISVFVNSTSLPFEPS
jgi:hypothetical protein